MSMINYNNDVFSSITFHEEMGDTGKVKLLWKKPECETKNEDVFNWVLNILVDKKSEKHFKNIGNEGIYGSESIKCLEEEVLENALNSGLDKVAVVLPQDIFPQRKTVGIEINEKIEYFSDEHHAKNWIKNIYETKK
jgi:hypothetical protein